MVQPSAYSQYLLELINRARLDPSGEASLYNIDLNQGLDSGAISTNPKQPLAFNLLLNDAAESHSQWMLDNDQFSHVGVNGSRAGDRITDAGYQYTTWGENVGYKGTTGTLDIPSFINSIQQSLFESPGHRQNMFKENFREVGLATLTGDFDGFNTLMMTQNFATANSDPFLTGVVFDDSINNNNFYSVGEGLANVNITAVRQSDNSSFFTSTIATGGYQLELEPGTYEVTFTSDSQQSTSQVTISTNNVKLDLNTEDLPNLSSDNILYGSAINDLLLGNTGKDTLYGGEGFDTLKGNQGNDLLYGGNGNDREDGNEGNDVIWGEWGDDTLYGGNGNDTLYGNQNADSLYGGWNDDFLDGGSGNDFLYSGIGNDIAHGAEGNDFIRGEWGDDTLYGSNGNDTLYGNQNADSLYGGWNDDFLDGGSGNDFLYSGIGNDVANGADGNDFIQGEWGNDTLRGGCGADTLEGNQNRDLIYGGWGNDYVNGGSDNDVIYLGLDNDYATGEGGEDYIKGEWGNDTLHGGQGSDTLAGNQNEDTFVYTAITDSLVNNPDLITDFTVGSDQLWLDLPNFAPTSIGSVNSLSQANSYFDGSSIKVAFSATESILYVDAGAQGIADMAIVLENVTALNLSDFV